MHIFFNKRKFSAFFLAIIICVISWLLLKIILSYREKGIENDPFWDFGDGTVVKTSPSNTSSAGSAPGQGA